jgi:putative FmdB family regulatory protein
MPLYDFECECGAKRFNVEFGMSDKKIVKCSNCKKQMGRVWGGQSVIVKSTLASAGISLGPNQAFADVDGKPVRMNFIDHGERGDTAPGGIARRMGARMDAKTGRPVVDVISNVKNPLAAMERSKGRSRLIKQVVNSPYNLRRK